MPPSEQLASSFHETRYPAKRDMTDHGSQPTLQVGRRAIWVDPLPPSQMPSSGRCVMLWQRCFRPLVAKHHVVRTTATVFVFCSSIVHSLIPWGAHWYGTERKSLHVVTSVQKQKLDSAVPGQDRMVSPYMPISFQRLLTAKEKVHSMHMV